ncbi:hypothetical protein HHI36_000851 [Cryptolaemus montrouzieri]|uniref:Coiled-coil-helix-coiled-coil-helix domain-containing protein 7 n=1 Tax=Cryptolaemus montrouzieri TaxID=559131 RepID=A0ABD2P6K0_9CUCU
MKQLKNDAAQNNPCLKEQELTYKCYNKNNFDYDKCALQIENYKSCKSFWHMVRMDRKRKGINPNVPPVEEREQVKKEYLSRFGK